MAAINEITGHSMVTKTTTDAYRNNYDRIFSRTKNSTNVVTSGEIKQESCDRSVPEISQAETLGITPSH